MAQSRHRGSAPACSEQVLKRYGGVDVLVNAAGFSAYAKENIIEGARGTSPHRCRPDQSA